MIQGNGTVDHQGNGALHIVSRIREIGIEIPKTVQDEVRLAKSYSESQKATSGAMSLAKRELVTVPASGFDKAKDDLVSLAITAFSLSNGIDKVLVEACSHRVWLAVTDALPEWETEVVERFNEVVDRYELNRVSADLPNLDLLGFKVMTMTRAQANAIEKWRDASQELQPLWQVYSKMASLIDNPVGPLTSDNLAINMFTACVLGDPGSFRTAHSVATTFAGIAGGSDAVSHYGPALPFILPAMYGYQLHLSTLDDATAIRRAIQPELTGTGGSIPATQMDYR